RTRCPLAMPPTAGLHDICAIRSTFSVNKAVRSPMRAEAIAASHPAWPAPTTTTSYCSEKFMQLGCLNHFSLRNGLAQARGACVTKDAPHDRFHTRIQVRASTADRGAAAGGLHGARGR